MVRKTVQKTLCVNQALNRCTLGRNSLTDAYTCTIDFKLNVPDANPILGKEIKVPMSSAILNLPVNAICP